MRSLFECLSCGRELIIVNELECVKTPDDCNFCGESAWSFIKHLRDDEQ